jgi:predicted nucleic acid-binding protein
MTVLLDSNVIIALLNTRDKNHANATGLLEKLKDPTYGMRLTIDYVLDEVLTTLWMHTRQRDTVSKAYRLVHHTPEFVKLEYMTPGALDLAWEKWERLAKWPEKPLSFTDCCILSFMDTNDVGYLATFDSDFKGLCQLV